MFTIRVKKREANEEFSFKDVRRSAEVSHNDCLGGKTIWSLFGNDWVFDCKRCSTHDSIQQEIQPIILTSIDNEERIIGSIVKVCGPEYNN